MRYDDMGDGGTNSDQRRTPGDAQYVNSVPVFMTVTCSTTASHSVCRFLHEVLLTGLRSMVEYGSVWNYYGAPGGFRYMHVHAGSHCSTFAQSFNPLCSTVIVVCPFSRALSVILYISFLFAVLVVLLNGLIAMMVGTYLSMQTISGSSFVYQRCRYIARVEREVHPLFCCWRVSV